MLCAIRHRTTHEVAQFRVCRGRVRPAALLIAVDALAAAVVMWLL